MDRVKAVVGLGNPDPEYAFTRHNLGSMVVERLRSDIRGEKPKRGKNCVIYKGKMARRGLLLVKTRVYVNESGRALLSLLKAEKLDPQDVLVACDDVSLPFGGLRIRRGGSSGGHKGLQSIIDTVGNDFPRLRLGVGGPEGGMVDHVLGEFSEGENMLIERVLDVAAETVSGIVREGLERAMSRYNRKDSWINKETE